MADLVAIYDDDLAKLFGDCSITIRRASHVEPTVDKEGKLCWQSDMGPVNGPVLSGFKTREDALAAEHEWLKDNILSKPNCEELAGLN